MVPGAGRRTALRPLSPRRAMSLSPSTSDDLPPVVYGVSTGSTRPLDGPCAVSPPNKNHACLQLAGFFSRNSSEQVVLKTLLALKDNTSGANCSKYYDKNTFIRQNRREDRQKDRHTHVSIYARQACIRYVRHKTKAFRLSDLHNA